MALARLISEMVKFGGLLFTLLSLSIGTVLTHLVESSLISNDLVESLLIPNMRWDETVALARTNKYYFNGIAGQLMRRWFKLGVNVDEPTESNLARFLEKLDLCRLGPFLEEQLQKELGLYNTPTERKEQIKDMLKFIELVKVIRLFPLTRDPELKLENQEKVMKICKIQHGTSHFTFMDMVVFGAAIRPSSIDMSCSIISKMSEQSKFLLMNHAKSKDIRVENHDLGIPENTGEVFFLYCWSIGLFNAKQMTIFRFNHFIKNSFHESTLWKILEIWKAAEIEIDSLTPEEIGTLMRNVILAGHSDELIRFMFQRAIKKRFERDLYALDRIRNTEVRGAPNLSAQVQVYIEKFSSS